MNSIAPSRIARPHPPYRSRGHLIADLDPLSFRPQRHPDLRLSSYGLSSWDLDRHFPTGDFINEGRTMTLREILRRLRSAYCSTTGYEYMHISDPVQRKWSEKRLEIAPEKIGPEKRRHILAKLNQAEAFEAFLHTKFLGQKRFSLEGGESLIPALDEILAHAANDGLAGRGHLHGSPRPPQRADEHRR